MLSLRALIAIIFLLPLPTIATAAAPVSDAQIRQAIIEASLASYHGNCPCPYNRMRNGRSCGAVSAYAPPGGASPLCYTRDVSQQTVEEYRRGAQYPKATKELSA